jgi:hypothetical protein
MERLSTAEALMLEKMQKCNCGRNLEAIYVCLKADCQDSKTQKYYCLECSNEENKHDHKSIAIVLELKSQHKKWTSLLDDVMGAFTTAEQAHKEMWPLINYLEEAMMQPGLAIDRPVKWLTADFNKLKQLNDSFLAVYNGQIK